MPAILLTGATGFVGGRLHDALERAGHRVRCLSRRPDEARRRRPTWDWIGGDVADEPALARAMKGCAIAYYLVHGMTEARPGWEDRELADARSFARAARTARVERLLYLGGIAPSGHPSPHLRARLETGRALREGEVPCLELRASMIIGHGSASWQMVRDLAVRLPVMVLPAWLRHRTEPVAITDVVGALVKGAVLPLPESRTEELPGPEAMSGRELLVRIAALVGHRPLIVEVPLVTPRLSSHWIRLVSGVDYKLARELVEGLTSDILAVRHDFWQRAGLAQPMRLEAAASGAFAEESTAMPDNVRRFEHAIGVISRRPRES